MNSGVLYAGVDIGAGSGAKIGLFRDDLSLVSESLLGVNGYGEDAGSLVAGLRSRLEEMAASVAGNQPGLGGAGIVGPGVFLADGTIARAANLEFLTGVNLGRLIEEQLQIPAACMNDADAGALAEWRYHGTELVYWVLGGGWGGAWVTEDGRVRFAQHAWSGYDKDIYPSNEPGYVLPLEKKWLGAVFEQAGISFSAFLNLVLRENGAGSGQILGPNKDPATVRAETVVSGSGRWLIMRTLVTERGELREGLTEGDLEDLDGPETAGRTIRKVEKAGLPLLEATDRLFGQVFAEAGGRLLERLAGDGLDAETPIFLAGKPARGFFSYGPIVQEHMRERGIRNSLLLSELQQRDMNPNLAGAAYLARKAAYNRETNLMKGG